MSVIMNGSPLRSLNNLTPADGYYGRQQQRLEERKKTKQLTMLHRRKSGTPQRLYLSTYFDRLKSLFLFSGFCPLSLDDIQSTIDDYSESIFWEYYMNY